MGSVRELKTGRLIILESHTLIGRGGHCNLQLTDPLVSSDHASLKWASTQWLLRDLGSTNGTWVNGEMLPKGRDVPVAAGSEIAFGSQLLAWHFADAHPPEPMVVPLADGEPCFIKDGVIAIPTTKEAGASVFQASDGTWTLELGDQVLPVRAGDSFDAVGRAWRFSCPTQWQPTRRCKPYALSTGVRCALT